MCKTFTCSTFTQFHRFFESHTTEMEIDDLAAVQQELVQHARQLGRSIQCSGGGKGLVNLPGLTIGELGGVVATIQTTGSIGGILFLIKVVVQLLIPRNKPMVLHTKN